jgi:flagellar biosynthesis/type III secretory pathway M-ring protein FliF/YscJ
MDDKDFMFQTEITTTLKSAEKDSPKALNYLMVGIVLAFFFFRMLSRRRRAKKAKKAAAAAKPAAAVQVNNRKGLRAARNGKPNPTQ